MSKANGNAFGISLLKRVMKYVRPYRALYWSALLITIISGFVSVIRPLIIGIMVGGLVVQPDVKELTNYAWIVLVLIFIEAVLQFFQSYMSSKLGQLVMRDIRTELFAHLVNFRLKFFDKTPIGTLVTRCVSDIETMSQIFSEGILVIIGDVLKLLAVLITMLILNWKATLIVCIPIPILLIATNIFKNAIKKAFQQVRQQVAKLNAFVQERITGMMIIQSFNREKIESEKFRGINHEHRKAHIKSVWAYSVFFPVVETLSALSVALLILYPILELKNEAFDKKEAAMLFTWFILFVHMLYRPIRMLADRFNTLQMGMVGSERVFNLLDTHDIITDKGTIKTNKIKGNLVFENVHFAYNEPEYILNGLSFKVNAGESVAFVGATGAGKSSVINLLSRFYEFQKGRILIDDVDLTHYELDTIRANVAVVLQDVFLFSDSVHNNITLRNETISREEVINAAKKVGAHKFIEKLPGGYDFYVGERGGTLSVGQRQLLAFIRAYVYNPSILILDEATSSVDTETELLIQEAIEKITEGRTSILIAHRLSTVQKADRIIVLDHGQIMEEGTHKELINKGGQYKKLFDLQLKK
ncbi:MAG: ABC transporter ATP-binding protein [Flavobacteriales bacterium]